MQTGESNGVTVDQWWSRVKVKKVREVANRMGTSVGYMRHLKNRVKRPGYDFAVRLISVAKEVTPDCQPDLATIMQPVSRLSQIPHNES